MTVSDDRPASDRTKGIDQERQRMERSIAEDTITLALKRFERETGLRVVAVALNRHSQTVVGTRDLMSCWITAELPR